MIEAFGEAATIDLSAEDAIYNIQSIENEYNLNIQILEQVDAFDIGFEWTNFNDVPDVYNTLYGDQFGIPRGILSRIIYDFNQQLLDNDSPYASGVKLSSESYTGYLVDIQSEFDQENEDMQMLGLCVAVDQEDSDYDMYYVLTITFQSITDSIRIFNSFTVVIGMVFMVLSFMAMFLVSYSFTNPILQINKIAEEIAGLDFSNRVDIRTEDEIGELGHSINKMSTQLEQNINDLQRTNDKLAKEILHKTDIDKMRREFIASASHELKTPLALIMGYSEALKLSDLDEESRNEYLNIILDETNKMNKLVMELLKLSQLESGKVETEYQEFNIQDLIQDTVNMFGLVIKENDIKLEINAVKKTINSDYTQLQTVLTNFINNAINHINEKKTIRIIAEETLNSLMRVSVFNTGGNIPEDEVKHVWDSFYKVDKARTRSYGGQGLGLSICRTSLDMLGYDYGVINHDDGVEFYFEIK